MVAGVLILNGDIRLSLVVCCFGRGYFSLAFLYEYRY